MIKVIVTEEFILGSFNKLQNVERANINKNEDGYLYVNDKFECDEKMADYLTGNNPINRTVAKVIEVIPEKKDIDKEDTEKKVHTRRKR